MWGLDGEIELCQFDGALAWFSLGSIGLAGKTIVAHVTEAGAHACGSHVANTPENGAMPLAQSANAGRSADTKEIMGRHT